MAFWLVFRVFCVGSDFDDLEKIIGHFEAFRRPDFDDLIFTNFDDHL